MARAMLSKPDVSVIFKHRSLPMPRRETAATLLDRGFEFLAAKKMDRWTKDNIHDFFSAVDLYNRSPNVLGGTYTDVYDWLGKSILKKEPAQVRRFAEKIYNARKGKHIQLHAKHRQCWDDNQEKKMGFNVQNSQQTNRQCVNKDSDEDNDLDCSDDNHNDYDIANTPDLEEFINNYIDDNTHSEIEADDFEADFV